MQMFTSPKAPFPITFTVRKSSKPNFVRLNLRNVDSFFPSCCSCLCLRSSDMVVSACNFRSRSTRLFKRLSEHGARQVRERRTFDFSRRQTQQQLCRSAVISIEQPLLLEPHRPRSQSSCGRSRHSPRACRMNWRSNLSLNLRKLKRESVKAGVQESGSPMDTVWAG